MNKIISLPTLLLLANALSAQCPNFLDCPASVTVSCLSYDPEPGAYGLPTLDDACCADPSKSYQGIAGLTHSEEHTNSSTACSNTTIAHHYVAYDCVGNTAECVQQVVITEAMHDLYVHFPDDLYINDCLPNGDFGQPEVLNQGCGQVDISYTDEMITVVPDACFIIERNWTVRNLCAFNPLEACINVPNPTPFVVLSHSGNLPGPIVSAPGTTGTWQPTVVKINAPDPSPTDYSSFYQADANCYQYTQHIKIIDTQKPVVNCPAGPVDICDLTDNNAQLWNEPYWLDIVNNTHDLSDAPTDISITATDGCSGSGVSIKYLLFLDLDQDGTMETVINSDNPPPADSVYFNNWNSPGYIGGTPRAFDERAVPADQQYRFALETTAQGNNREARLRWNTPAAPGTFINPHLPYGTHKIKWIIGDGCGNETVCEYQLIIRDCKKPTVVCLNGISVNIMPTGLITLWAADFLQFMEDNATPSSLLKIGIVKSAESTGSFPVDGMGNPLQSATFDCSELGIQLVELWSIDLAGNADFCETYVLVQDNLGNCGNPQVPIQSCATSYCDGSPLAFTSFQFVGGAGIPTINITDLSDGDWGCGTLDGNGIPILSNYTLTPVNNWDPLNGVNSFDLYQISRHILGLQPLSSPFAMIAADINRSGAITTYDLIEARKLLLGIYNEFPNNTSWRFVRENFVFPNPANAFQSAFPESIALDTLPAGPQQYAFLGVKVGDVDCTAYPGFGPPPAEPEDRSATFLAMPDVSIPKGQRFELPVSAAAAGKLASLQGVLAFDPELVEVTGLEQGMLADLDWSQPKAGRLHFIWAEGKPELLQRGEVLFRLRLRAREALQSGEVFSMAGKNGEKGWASRAFDENGSGSPLELRFENPEILSPTGDALAALPYPNPIPDGRTVATLTLHLPQAATVSAEVRDVEGRLLYQTEMEMNKGKSFIELPAQAFPQAGTYVWRVQCGDRVEVGKLVRL